MRKLFISALCAGLLIVSSPAVADKDKVYYEVKITVVYNALSINDAKKKIGEILYEHQSACKTKVGIEKVNSTNSFGYIDSTDSTIEWIVVEDN